MDLWTQKGKERVGWIDRVASTYVLLLFSCSVVSNSLQPQGLQHTRLHCPSRSLWVCSNSCPLSQWCYLTISSSTTHFSYHFQFIAESGSFPMSRLFPSGGPSIGGSASALPMNIQGWFPLRLTGLMSLQSWVQEGCVYGIWWML